MEPHSTAKHYADPGQLRRFMLIPMGWLVFVVVLPDFILGVLHFKMPLLTNLTEAVCILLWGGFLAYLLVQVRKERGLVMIVLAGLGLLLLSDGVRVSRELELLEYLPIPDVNFLSRHFQNAMTGLGYAVIALAFIYAIIDMLAAQRQLEAEQAHLSQEIEHRKQAETTLRESEEKFSKAFFSNADMFVISELDTGRFIDVNLSAERVLGYCRDELLGKSALDLGIWCQPEDREWMVEQVKHGTSVLGLETRQRRKSGEIFYASVSADTITFAGKKCLFSCTRDITGQKAAEESLKQSETRYRSLVDHSGEIVWRMDLDGWFTFVSPVIKKLAGYAPEELIGQPFESFMDMESAEKGRQILRDQMADKFRDKSIVFEVISKKKDGSTFPSEILFTPIYDPDGHLLELQGVTRDITERVQSSRLIAEQQAKMIHSSRLSALGTMAGGIAHEINNPLAIISVAAEMLRTLLDAEIPDRRRIDKAPETIMHHVNRIYRIVQGLKMLSRDDALDTFSSIPVRNLVTDTLELCQTRFMAHGISLIVPDIPAELEIECRRSQFSQVLVNLLTNAFDAVENLSEKWVRLEVQDEGSWVAVAITDSGPGLAPAIKDKVLDPFFTTKEPGKGVGLGLSVSSRILETQHGELLIDSDCPNTRFVVRLPKRQPDSSVSPRPEELNAAN